MTNEFSISKTGTRGKYAEGRFKKFLKAQESVNATHYRFPDARAGSFTVTPCDFMFMKESKAFFIEVKEVEHEYRLPHRNFAPDQVARMRQWKMAGAVCRVLVCHRTVGYAWRVVDIDFFLTRDKGSWDLSGFKSMGESDAFSSTILI